MIRRWLPVCGLLLLCLIIFWKLAFSDEYVWFDHPDMCYIEIPRLQVLAREFHNGRFPLWDPYVWMGQPLIGQTQPGPVYPLNLIFALLPLKGGYLQFRYLNLYWVVIHCIAAVCAYALCRDLRRSRTASTLAGVAFAFGGFVGTVAWLDVINGAIWTPAICLFFLRAARARDPWRNAIFCGGVLALAWLSGHHEIPLMVSYALAGGWLWAIGRGGRRLVGPALATFAVAGLVAAVQLWPTMEYARLSERWVGMEKSFRFDEKIPYAAPSVYSMPVKGLLGVVLDDSASYGDSAPFMGLTVTALAIAAIATGWRRRAVRWMTALAVVGLIYALGALTPLHGLLFSFAPMLNKARIPVRAIHLANFALAVLAAYGLDCLLARGSALWARRIQIALGALAALVFGAAVWRRDVSDTLLWSACAAISLAVFLHAHRRGRVTRRAGAAALLAIAIFELYPVVNRRLANRHDKAAFQFVRTLTENHDVADYLRGQPAPRRVTVNDQDVPANFGDWHGIDMMEGYLAGTSSNLLRLGRHTEAAQNLLNITHHVGRKPDKPDQVEVFQGATGVKVFRTASPLPRAWAVHRAEQVPDIGAALERPDFDPRAVALMLGAPPPLEACGGDEVEVLAHAPNRVRIRAALQCRGLVVLSDTHYPGWEAEVDGRPAPILEAYGALRGVVLEGGRHEIDFRYRPLSVYGGAALSLCGLLIVTGTIVSGGVGRKRGGSRRPAELRG